ncbi:hypothetical protein GF382_01275 [Candidatus Falkowbacteria bacterium]|nr:hypothetical protein [Candidatus Falkowbacteria bacterium]
MNSKNNLGVLERKNGSPNNEELDDIKVLHNHLNDFEKPAPPPASEKPDDELFHLGEEHEHEGEPVAIESPEEPPAMTIEDLEKGETPINEKEKQEDEAQKYGRHIESRKDGPLTPEGMKFFQDMGALRGTLTHIKHMEDGPEKEKAMEKFDRIAGFETGIKKKGGDINLKEVEAMRMARTKEPFFQKEKDEGVVYFQSETAGAHEDEEDEVNMTEIRKQIDPQMAALEDQEDRDTTNQAIIDRINKKDREKAEEEKRKALEEENKRWQQETAAKKKKAEELEKAQKKHDDERHELGIKKRRDIMAGDQAREDFERTKTEDRERAAEIKKMKEKKEVRRQEMKQAEQAREEDGKMNELRKRVADSAEQAEKNKEEENRMIGEGLRKAALDAEIKHLDRQERADNADLGKSEEQKEDSKKQEKSEKAKQEEPDLKKDIQINVANKAKVSPQIEEMKKKIKDLENKWKNIGGDRAKEVEEQILSIEDKIRQRERQEKSGEHEQEEIDQLKQEIKDLENKWKSTSGDRAKKIEGNILNKEEQIRQKEQTVDKADEPAIQKKEQEVPETAIKAPEKELSQAEKDLLSEIKDGNLERIDEISDIGTAEAEALIANLDKNALDLTQVENINTKALSMFNKAYEEGGKKALILIGLKTINGSADPDESALKILSSIPKDRIFLPDDLKRKIDGYRPEKGASLLDYRKKDENSSQPKPLREAA